MDPTGTLRLVLDANPWNSTLSFSPAIPVSLNGGSLNLLFAPGTDPSTQLGRTFHLFDWTGVTPSGSFSLSSPYSWDTSNLYTTGNVTLISVPEPASLSLLTPLALLSLRRRKV